MSAPNTEVSSLEFSRANGPEMALTDAGGVVTASPNTAIPLRNAAPPRPSRDVLDFFPVLLPFVTRDEWLERRAEELSIEKIDADEKRVAAEEKLAEMTLKIDKEREELEEAQRMHAIQLQVKDKAISEREANLARQEEEAKERGSRPRWIPHNNGPDADLYDAVWALGDKIDKAMRDMRNLVTGKNRAEQAFSRWERTFCEQSIKLVQLDERLRSKQDKQNQETKEQEAMLEAREGVVTDTESRLNMEKESLENDRQAFSLEQSQWRDGRARNLEGTDLEVVQQLWLQAKEEQIIPALRAEARSLATIEVENQLEPVHRAACAEAKSEGHTEGMAEALQVLEERERAAHEAGSASGRDAGRIEGHGTGRCEGFAMGRPEGYRDGYETGKNEGHETGRSEGHTAGRVEGYKDGYETGKNEGHEAGVQDGVRTGRQQGLLQGSTVAQPVRDDCYYRGVHTSMLVMEKRNPGRYQRDRDGREHPNPSHAYWIGRAVARNIKLHHRLDDRDSPWYNAECSTAEPLSVRPSRESYSGPRADYWDGINDGLFYTESDQTPVRNWAGPGPQ